MNTKITGGQKWKEYIASKYLKKGKYNVKVGILSGATHSQDHYPNTKSGKEKKQSKKAMPKLLEIAFWHEFGTKNAPARSFLRSTFDEKQKEWIQTLRQLLRTMTLQQALDQLGGLMVDDVVQKIKSGLAPGLSQSTLDLRRANKIQGTKPLMASRELITAIAFEVES